jgi:hypothetical protein
VGVVGREEEVRDSESWRLGSPGYSIRRRSMALEIAVSWVVPATQLESVLRRGVCFV